ncbi:MAG: LytTR family DNA-binding domain-containing protein [Bacteroidota bacterium]
MILSKSINNQHILFAFIGLTILVSGKDLLESLVRDYSFYLSESLLFGTFWSIFIPLLLINELLFKKFTKRLRLILPLLFCLIHVTAFSLLVYLVSYFFFSHTFGFYQTFIEVFLEDSISCILVYGTFFLILRKKRIKKEVQKPDAIEKIKVFYQKRILFLNCKDILYVKSEKPYIAIVTNDKTYLHNSTLKGFLEKDLSENFLQIHKSTLINTNYITSYLSRKNGDYDIFLANKYSVRASRNFRENFIKHL